MGRIEVGDGALTGVGMEAADALMQVSWIVKGPPAGPQTRTLPTCFFFPAVLSRPVQTVVRSSVRVSPAVSCPLPLPSSPLPPWVRPYRTLTAAWLPPRMPGRYKELPHDSGVHARYRP